MNEIPIPESVITYLRNRGLVVKHRKSLEDFLACNSYYRVSDYVAYRISDTSGSRTVMNDAELLRIYELDGALRQAILEGISIIEITLRSRFMYSLGEDGHTTDYLTVDNYKEIQTSRRNDKREKLVAEIQRWISRSKEKNITQFVRVNAQVPLCAAIEVLPFGTISEMMSLHKDSQALKRVYASIGLHIKLRRAHEIIHSLVYLRNLSAHHARLWMRRVMIKPPRITYKESYYARIQDSIGPAGEFSVGSILLPLIYLVDTILGNTEYSERIIGIVSQDSLFYKGIMKRTL